MKKNILCLFVAFLFVYLFYSPVFAEQFDTQWTCNGSYASGSMSDDCASYSQFPVPAFTVTPDHTSLKFATPFYDDISFHAGIGTYRIRDGDGEVFTDQSPYWYYITISQGSPETFPDDTYSLEYSIVDSSTRAQIVYFHVIDGLFYLDVPVASSSSSPELYYLVVIGMCVFAIMILDLVRRLR